MARVDLLGDSGGWGQVPRNRVRGHRRRPWHPLPAHDRQPYGEVPVFNGPYVD
jgi:hypothetical protein